MRADEAGGHAGNMVAVLAGRFLASGGAVHPDRLGVVEAESFDQGRLEWRDVAGEGQSILLDVDSPPVGLRSPPRVPVIVRGDG